MKSFDISWAYNFGGVYTIQANTIEEAEEIFHRLSTFILVPNIEEGSLEIDEIVEKDGE